VRVRGHAARILAFSQKEEFMSAFRVALCASTALLLASTASRADTCDAIKAQIDAKIRSGGMGNFALETVDAAASAPGRVVGNCGGGAKKIVMLGGSRSASTVSASTISASAINASAVPVRAQRSAAAKPQDNVLTECNDGSMSVGGSCKK
jgi:hypothetical protein